MEEWRTRNASGNASENVWGNTSETPWGIFWRIPWGTPRWMPQGTSQGVPHTVWKVSKYGVFSGPYFPVFGLNTEIYGVFSPNTGKYGPGKTPCLDTFHAVSGSTFGNALRNTKFFRNSSAECFFIQVDIYLCSELNLGDLFEAICFRMLFCNVAG